MPLPIKKDNMQPMKTETISSEEITLHWNLSRERVTLGGALTLRAECEIVSKLNGQRIFNILITPGTNSTQAVDSIFETVFNSSMLVFNIIETADEKFLYPDSYLTFEGYLFSYSTERIASLVETCKVAPKLTWSKEIYSEVDKILATLHQEFICMSFKNSGLSIMEGDAEIAIWQEVVRTVSIELGKSVVIVGNDPITEDFSQNPCVRFLGREGTSLATQLALSERARLYVGMASGMASSATFSDTPYLLYKHPEYHAELMNRELGESDSLPCANDQQKLIRKIPNTSDVIDSIRGILSK